MGSNYFKDQHHQPHFLIRKLLPWALYALLPLAILRLYFYPLSVSEPLGQPSSPPQPPIALTTSRASEEKQIRSGPAAPAPCNYTVGRWVRDRSGPRYNGTSCATIKDGQNCMAHGRPDTGYLYWKWRPAQCKLSRFQPATFLRLLRDKHIAFIGDSMARNQLESLLCLISGTSDGPPTLVYRNGEDNKFRRWRVESHNLTISIYWSPFLVKGVEKSASGPNYNKLYVGVSDDRWASEAEQIDVIVFSVGHWFLHPAVYYERDDEAQVLGCHYCPGTNHTEIGFYEVFRRAIRTALAEATARGRGGLGEGKERRVVLTTFSPSHFEGKWDKFGACPKIEPYKPGEKTMEWMDQEMRKIEVEEAGAAGRRVEALDVTELAMMRPDGHPGPYMYPDPFANGVGERVQNDCVHWCLPGPIDTWNEILLDMMKRWERKSNENS